MSLNEKYVPDETLDYMRQNGRPHECMDPENEGGCVHNLNGTWPVEAIWREYDRVNIYYITEQGENVCPQCAGVLTSDPPEYYAELSTPGSSITCDDCGGVVEAYAE